VTGGIEHYPRSNRNDEYVLDWSCLIIRLYWLWYLCLWIIDDVCF
jgi:hypothetical protein